MKGQGGKTQTGFKVPVDETTLIEAGTVGWGEDKQQQQQSILSIYSAFPVLSIYICGSRTGFQHYISFIISLKRQHS